MPKGYVFYFVREVGYVIEDYCPLLTIHRMCKVYDTPEDAQEGINQLLMQ